MKATAIVKGRVVAFTLPPGLAAAHRRHQGERMTEAQALNFVESKRRAWTRKRAAAYSESRP